MGDVVFGNEFFDQWLTQKTTEILAKVEHGTISNEDMLILSLKAQVNHFHHMDIEFREEFGKIRKRFEQVDKRFEQIDKRFELIDRRFERQTQVMMWGFGLMTTLMTGMFYKILQLP